MKILKKRCGELAPEMFGLFFEDINFAADGGLYAELIENRSFEAREAFGNPGNFYAIDDYGYAWSAIDGASLKFVTGTPLSMENPHYLRFEATKAGQGFSNKAYDGIYLKANEKINVEFYARAVKFDGCFKVALVENEAEVCSEMIKCKPAVPFAPFTDLTVEFVPDDPMQREEIQRIDGLDKNAYAPTSSWIKYQTSLVVPKDVKRASFAITVDGEAVVDFDFISAIPDSAVCGVFRKDLFEALKAIKPGFIRFPGGCIVEGISLENRYQWKKTVGDKIHRKYIPNLWAFDDDRKKELNARRPDCHYGQSYGIGFYEYFLLCELLGAKPLPVLSMGVACQFRSTEITELYSEEFYQFVQDAIDLIEFANGPVDSKWGALRAKMGHPKPFDLELLGVGNEQWETNALQLFKRNDIIEQKIHEQYPQIKLIGTGGPAVDMPICAQAWDYYRTGSQSKENFVYAIDEHYYKSPEWMYDNVTLYDGYKRDINVFAGEYAAHTKDRANDMTAAVSEAAFMTGLEKNGDIVRLASYAPLFNRIGHSQWTPDMIWFDAEQVYLTPNYYVQKMFSNNLGKYMLELSEEAIALRNQGVYVSLQEDCDGTIILKAANTNEAEFSLELTDEAGNELAARADIETLTSAGERINDMPEPSEISIKQADVAGCISLPAKSFSVIRLK